MAAQNYKLVSFFQGAGMSFVNQCFAEGLNLLESSDQSQVTLGAERLTLALQTQFKLLFVDLMYAVDAAEALESALTIQDNQGARDLYQNLMTVFEYLRSLQEQGVAGVAHD